MSKKPKSRNPSTTPPEPIPVLRTGVAVIHIANISQLRLIQSGVNMALKRDDTTVRVLKRTLLTHEYYCDEELITPDFIDIHSPVYVYLKG